MQHYLIPSWPKPRQVTAVCTLRTGGYSQPPFDSFNCADHVGDLAQHVKCNRDKLSRDWQLTHPPCWLQQTHSANVTVIRNREYQQQADASITQDPNTTCVVVTADCLPICVCNHQGSEVAAIHAGWRGVLGGIIQNTIHGMHSPASSLMAWLGPAIGPSKFELNTAIQSQFTTAWPAAAKAFNTKQQAIYCDLYELATTMLEELGVQQIYSERRCTVTEEAYFYSYRREGQTGRMTTMITIQPE